MREDLMESVTLSETFLIPSQVLRDLLGVPVSDVSKTPQEALVRLTKVMLDGYGQINMQDLRIGLSVQCISDLNNLIDKQRRIIIETNYR